MAVASYGSRIEADMMRDLLEDAGIPAYVSGDDAGGMRPHFQLTLGVRLIVLERDARRAHRLLEEQRARE